VAQARDVGQIVFNPERLPMTALAGLPPITTRFLGRDEELHALQEAVSVVVSGLAGIGKTELVLHAAHNAAPPGGVLFIDLQGYDDERRVTPARALDDFLRALGVSGEDIPPEEAQRATLYRSLLSEAPPMVIVLDNASSAGQVLPLLPGKSHHRVLITSRHTLSGLDNARRVEINLLSEADATELVGDADVARLCGMLPLALRIMAALRADHPDVDWAAELREAQDRLEIMDDGDSRAVHSAFALSYNSLAPDQQRLFRLLALHPGDELMLEGAVALAHLSVTQTRRLVRELRRAHLLDETELDWYQFHDLVRLYAHRCLVDESPDERAAALRRVLEHFLTRTESACSHVDSSPSAPRSGAFENARAALSWLTRRRSTLVSAVASAAEAGEHDIVRRFAWSLYHFFDATRHSNDWISVNEHAIKAAQHLGDKERECVFRIDLGHAHRQLRHIDIAMTCYTEARELSVEIGDRHQEGRALHSIATLLHDTGSFHESLAYGMEALTIQREVRDMPQLAQSLASLGATFFRLRRYEDSIAFHRRALKIFEALGDRYRRARTKFDLGMCYATLERFDEAISAFHESITESRELDAREFEGIAYRNLGITYERAGRLDEARAAWIAALAWFDQVDAETDARRVADWINDLDG
jgi:tetratricopeptide (TPR) repeat protein